MKVIGYVRVSTDKQAAHGVSLDAQIAKIKAQCALLDYELIGIEVDGGESASNLNRPALQRALKALKGGEAQGLVVCKLDRLTRNVRDLGALIDDYFTQGLSLISVAEQVNTATAIGRMVLNVMTSISQWEREAIGERTSAAMQHKIARNEYTGGKVPLGKRVAADGVHLEDDPDFLKVLELIANLRTQGLSLAKIASELNRRGVKRQGTDHGWTKGAVHRALAA